MTSAVVGGGEHREQLAASKSFEAVHYTLVSTQDELGLVVFEEKLDTIGAKLDNVSCAVGVSDEVGLDAKFLIAISGIRPQDINDELLLRG